MNVFMNIKLGLAILLLLCLLPMPYGYYMLVRFVAMIAFVGMAIDYWQTKRTTLCVVACSLALLFQPFLKIALGRGLWNLIDVVIAVALLYDIIRKKKANS